MPPCLCARLTQLFNERHNLRAPGSAAHQTFFKNLVASSHFSVRFFRRIAISYMEGRDVFKRHHDHMEAQPCASSKRNCRSEVKTQSTRRAPRSEFGLFVPLVSCVYPCRWRFHVQRRELDMLCSQTSARRTAEYFATVFLSQLSPPSRLVARNREYFATSSGVWPSW